MEAKIIGFPDDRSKPVDAFLSKAETKELDRILSDERVVGYALIGPDGEELSVNGLWSAVSSAIFANVLRLAERIGSELGEDQGSPVVAVPSGHHHVPLAGAPVAPKLEVCHPLPGLGECAAAAIPPMIPLHPLSPTPPPHSAAQSHRPDPLSSAINRPLAHPRSPLPMIRASHLRPRPPSASFSPALYAMGPVGEVPDPCVRD